MEYNNMDYSFYMVKYIWERIHGYHMVISKEYTLKVPCSYVFHCDLVFITLLISSQGLSAGKLRFR